jgi:hypothetical protein
MHGRRWDSYSEPCFDTYLSGGAPARVLNFPFHGESACTQQDDQCYFEPSRPIQLHNGYATLKFRLPILSENVGLRSFRKNRTFNAIRSLTPTLADDALGVMIA